MTTTIANMRTGDTARFGRFVIVRCLHGWSATHITTGDSDYAARVRLVRSRNDNTQESIAHDGNLWLITGNDALVDIDDEAVLLWDSRK